MSRADSRSDLMALKPCPFCGGNDLTLTVNRHGWKIVECDNCGMRGPCIDLEGDEYLNRWNTRAASQPDREARAGIYIASKTKHADRWRFLRDKVGEPIISTWIDEAGEGESSDLHDLWHRCLTEAASCRVLIAYREKDEVLKGGWVEIGAALSAGIPVYAVGLEEFTIAKYRGIIHFPDMKAAVAASRSLLSGAGTKSDGGEERPASGPSSRVTHGPSDPDWKQDQAETTRIKPRPMADSSGAERGIEAAALSAPVGEPMPRGGAAPDWWAESIKLYRQNKLLRKALKEQHDWHLAQGEKDFGEGITLNMADEYGDSGMCERTTAALDAVLPSGIEGYEKWKEQNTDPPAPAVGADVREVVAYQMVGEFASPDYPSVNITPYKNVANLWRSAGAEVRELYALTRPLGGFVQGSIARKQSTDTEGSSRTETAGGEG